MTRHPWPAALLAVGLFGTSCGGGASVSNLGNEQQIVTPALHPLHRTLPASAFGTTVPFGPGHCVRPVVGPGVGPRKRCKPTKAELARQPASPFERVRLVAELRLARPKLLRQRALFVVYGSRGVGPCFDVVSDPAAEQLACLGTTRCPSVCLGWYVDAAAFGLAPGSYTLLWGLLPARADRLRVQLAGRSVLYALTGPAAPRFPGRRVFMADLGRHPPPTRVEVVSDGQVVVTATRRELMRGRR